MTGLRAIAVCKVVVPAVLALALSGTSTFAASGQDVATLEAARGQVTLIRLGNPTAVTAPMALQSDDVVVTRQGRATVRFDSDGTTLRIGPDSRVQIDESATQRDVTVFFGRLWAHVVRWKEHTSRFATSSTIAAIRGTEVSFGVASDGDLTQVAVLEGVVEAETDAGSLTLQGGQSATGRKGAKPTPGIRVKPQDAVQWALYYLPVIYAKPGDLGQGQEWQTKARESSEAFLKGDLATAIESVDGIAAEGINAPGFFTYRASLRLAAGAVEGAEKDIAQAMKLSANDADALALSAIVAVARNDNDKALATARQAVSSNPQSSTAQIALSYALQARFDLEGARQALETAVTADPNDALAWARLAEIRSSLGQGGQALEAAEKAASLQPNLSRTQTVLGFAHLTRVHTAEARAALEKAIALDQDDPLPRLGLGLAKIRDGHLKEGLADIEVAVGLDPAQSLIRSYLGKAYFEAKRTDLDTREFDLAKSSDPNDPTPWFYDAIAKQTTNQPIEALDSLEEAIDLNDNRAVYRSRLLLDSDLAARSSSLGRIYSDLGFQDRALVEGWNSVNADPTNYSAHRFHADSYAALPRHEIARVSELLQSQLLQPLNMTPIQPRLGESNLLLIGAAGPASLSFSEFNPLFGRDGVSFLGNGIVGEDGLWSGEGVLAGIYKKMSFSAGYSQFSTDGWRENALQDDKIANALVQVEVSPRASIQAEYRYRDRTTGDLQQNFFPDNFLPGLTGTQTANTFRLGGRQSFSPASTVLVSATYQDLDDRALIDEGPDFMTDAASNQKAWGLEVQHLYRSRRLDVTAGVGYFNIDGEIKTTSNIFGEVLDLPAVPTKYDHVDAYAYANVKPITEVTITVGGSFDHLAGDLPGGDLDQFNPKVGVTWNPLPGTTIRGAAFRVLKRTLITNQTLEPTQVAGFNQFYDESNQTDGWRYGGGVDQKLGRRAYVGAEFSKRDLEFPFVGFEGSEMANWDESLGRAYVFATPHPWLALSAQYLYERFDRQDLLLGFKQLKTYRVPLGVGFFHPSGLTLSATATYWNQKGQFEQLFEPDFLDESSTFWLVDAAVSYRLPKRYGFITIGAKNLFDKDFNYFEVAQNNPTIVPKRSIFARLTLAVP